MGHADDDVVEVGRDAAVRLAAEAAVGGELVGGVAALVAAEPLGPDGGHDLAAQPLEDGAGVAHRGAAEAARREEDGVDGGDGGVVLRGSGLHEQRGEREGEQEEEGDAGAEVAAAVRVAVERGPDRLGQDVFGPRAEERLAAGLLQEVSGCRRRLRWGGRDSRRMRGSSTAGAISHS